MNYNDKDKNDRIENDELNIKSHLNTSFDLSGISVSEELINRTLAAIKEQSSKEEITAPDTAENEAEKKQSPAKIIRWSKYVRGAAGVAAAVLVVMIGYAAIRQFPVGMKKADSSTQQYSLMNEETTADSAAPEAAGAADSSMTESAAADASVNANDFTITAEPNSDTADTSVTAKADAGTTTGTEEPKLGVTAPADSNTNAQESEDRSITSDGLEATPGLKYSMKAAEGEGVFYTFRDIFVPSPEQAEYIMITDNTSNASITLTDQADIQDFYTLMDDHQFTSNTVAGEGEQTFTVEMNSPDTQTLYTMLVGDYLTLRYTQGDTTTESIYDAEDPQLFLGDVETFYLEHKTK